MSALPVRKYSREEDLKLGRNSEARLEYRDGEIFDKSGVSEEHAEIELNIIESLRPRLTRQGCRLFPANMRMRVPSMPPYRYGDLSALRRRGAVCQNRRGGCAGQSRADHRSPVVFDRSV
jgi:Uma2 family endonuclease